LVGHTDALEAGVRRLEEAGCQVRLDAARAGARWRGYLAGDDDDRAAEIVSALGDPEVDVVWLARGGSGAARVVETVIDALRRRPCGPKVLVGFSDATSLLNALALELGWIVFHGPVVTSLGREEPQCDLRAVLSTLRGERSEFSFPAQPGPEVSGVLLGGNLTVLASRAGAPQAAPSGEAIWFIEEVAEPPYRIDRCFWQLRESGRFEEAAAIWLGDLGVDPSDRAGCVEALRADAGDVPMLEGAPAGHRGFVDLLPIGARVRLCPTEGRLSALEPWVEVR